jgi:hypothetical protein
MNQSIMGRTFKVTTSLRCDFCNKQIPVGKYATQVNMGKAQGIYHGPRCYDAARKHYEELEKQKL